MSASTYCPACERRYFQTAAVRPELCEYHVKNAYDYGDSEQFLDIMNKEPEPINWLPVAFVVLLIYAVTLTVWHFAGN